MKLHWQQDFKHRAFPKFALNPNRPAVQFNNHLRKAQPEPLPFFVVRIIGLPKPLKDMWQIPRTDADTVIRTPQDDMAALCSRLKHNAFIFRRIFDSVIGQNGKELPKERPIS